MLLLLYSLPVEIGALKNLKKLYLQKNRLVCIPQVSPILILYLSSCVLLQSLGGCVSLEVLDVSCNCMELFPAEVSCLFPSQLLSTNLLFPLLYSLGSLLLPCRYSS